MMLEQIHELQGVVERQSKTLKKVLENQKRLEELLLKREQN